jgi:cell division protein FtsB
MTSTTQQSSRDWLDFSLRSIIFILVGISLFVWYVYILLFGENSLSILYKLEDEKAVLHKQATALKHSNQVLQKKYFELIQLSGDASLY